MKKEFLIKYLNGELDEQGERTVLAWLKKNSHNMDYFISLKSIYTSVMMPDSIAESPVELATLKKIMFYDGSHHRRKIRRIAAWAAIASLLIIGISNIYLLTRTTAPAAGIKGHELLSYIPEGYKHEIYTEKGVKANITLPDSSHVILNCDTRIVFPDHFTGPTREVFISGEAFFEVTSDSLVPMVVTTPKNFRIEVTGTTFNVRSYEDEEESQATLLSGRVNIISKAGKKDGKEVVTVLRPNESYVIKTGNTPQIIASESDISKEVAWKDGRLVFELTPMRDIITKMERWHGVIFIVKDPEVLDYKITGNFKSESVVQIMEMIKYTSLIDYFMTENMITLFKKRK
jgi:ferric-dicitrate binding protein FerR (iron transport regulator)